MNNTLFLTVLFSLCAVAGRSQRRDLSLDAGWHTVASEKDSAAFGGFAAIGFDDQAWKTVDIPHNWDDYGGYRRLRHGNLHGYAWYRKNLLISKKEGLRYFLWFEGVGSYATVWVNGRLVGRHAGGRTSFTLDITDALRPGPAANSIAVRADHPANIRDLPWVCGGCSDDRGFSEGSQPMGIFRPVHLVITHPTRIEPFGTHIWNDTTVSERSALLHLATEIKNYSRKEEDLLLVQRLLDKQGTVMASIRSSQRLAAGQTIIASEQSLNIANPQLWSTGHPYLYRLVTELIVKDQVIDRLTTLYGIRRIHWTDTKNPGAHPFLLNGKPVFINGIAEYEHRLGQSHAFTAAEIRARVQQIKAAGFNAFRDAHQPHNLLYQQYWDSLGFLWWPQLSAHIWFDTPEFRANFKTLLTEWIKERRNSPSIVLWGLQNESKLPEDFAKECTELIRQLDPTASSQRLITTCNGGTGTDWDVPQNWTGTYGGDPATYAEDLRRQVLVGEYGAWRTEDQHAEPTVVAAGSPQASFAKEATNSEDRMDQLMETKIRLAESVKDQVAGHFAWLYSSHDNPGRVQSGEGWREPDRIGPVNNKGLLTSWEEPLDAWYLYRSNYVSGKTSPMVYIVSHTWPDRWTTPGRKDGIIVYSNCDEVELFNDVHTCSLGKRKRSGIGTHFQWDDADIKYNLLYAVGYIGGKAVAKDCIVLHHLPQPPHYSALFDPTATPTGDPTSGMPGGQKPKSTSGLNYLYRVNCGGPTYIDKAGNTWLADRHFTGGATWGSRSWTDGYPGLPPFFASQRRTQDPITNTTDGPLFQDFRYGLEKLTYTFPVQDGHYRLELYFVEPWLGTGGGLDCTGWRQFDVAVNGHTVLKDLDIWKEAGHDRVLKKTVDLQVTGGKLVISFPHIAAGQALISALAIATADNRMTAAPPSRGLIEDWKTKVPGPAEADDRRVRSWLDTGDPVYSDDSACFSALPPNLYGAEWIQGPFSSAASFRVTAAADVFIGADSAHTLKIVHRQRYPAGATIALDTGRYTVAVVAATTLEPAYDSKPVTTYKAANARVAGDTLEWDMSVGVGDTYSLTIKYRYLPATAGAGRLEVRMEDGTLIKEEPVSFMTTPATKWNYINSTTGTMINAGHYKIRLIAHPQEGLRVDELQVQ